MEPFLLEGDVASHSNHAGLVAELDLDTGVPSPLIVADETLRLASGLLAEGLEISKRRRSNRRSVVGAGVGCAALLASTQTTSTPMKRRRFLNRLVKLGILASLTPSLGYSLLSEVVVPQEMEAFRSLLAKLEVFRPAR